MKGGNIYIDVHGVYTKQIKQTNNNGSNQTRRRKEKRNKTKQII